MEAFRLVEVEDCVEHCPSTYPAWHHRRGCTLSRYSGAFLCQLFSSPSSSDSEESKCVVTCFDTVKAGQGQDRHSAWHHRRGYTLVDTQVHSGKKCQLISSPSSSESEESKWVVTCLDTVKAVVMFDENLNMTLGD